MNKSEIRELSKVVKFHDLGMRDTAARSLSALIRSARTNKSIKALREYADLLKLNDHPDFIC